MVARCLFIESAPHLDLILQLMTLAALCLATLSSINISTTSTYAKSSPNPKSSIKFSRPMQIFSKILAFDRIAGIPYGSLPTATGLALHHSFDDFSPQSQTTAPGG